MSAVNTLPQAFLWLIPELTRLRAPRERLSDCDSCPMTRIDMKNQTPRFSEASRCCTFIPQLMNFSVGQILRDGGLGAEKMDAMLRNGQVDATGVKPPVELVEAFENRGPEDFGRNQDLRCPYWVGGTHACGVWAHRNHVCRTWFCRHEHGVRGLTFWTALSLTLQRAEHLLAAWCIATGDPPGTRARRKDWEAWFRWCADAVDRIEVVQLMRLDDDEILTRRRQGLIALRHALSDPIPEVLGATVASMEPVGDEVVLTGYSPYQKVRVPRSIFVFLSKLDGRPWKQALADTNAEVDVSIDETTVVNLVRLGVVSAWGEEHEIDRRDAEMG